MKKEANHVADVQLSGRRSLPVFKPVDKTDFELRGDTPKRRADCPGTRPCPFYKCENNAWTVTGQDRPGRRWVDGDMPATVVRPTVDQNCIADWGDAVDAGMKLESWMIAEVLGISERQVRRYVAHGMSVLAENPDANRELAQAIAERIARR